MISIKNIINKKEFFYKFSNLIPYLAFFFLFPGFFIYHTLLGLGAINAILGGYFSFVSIFFFPLLLFRYITYANSKKINIYNIDFYYFIYLLYFFSIVVINFIDGANQVIVINHIAAIIYSLNIFMIFKMVNFKYPTFKIFSMLSLFVMSAIVFIFSVDGAFYLAPLGIALDPESVATYQGFSRSYLITFIVVISFTRQFYIRSLLYFLAVPTLFLNTARSEFAALLLLIPIIEFYHSKSKMNFILFFSFLLISIMLLEEKILSLFPNNRTLELLDLSQSTSANLRHHLTLNAVKTIFNNPLFGDYASYASGYYSHNFLSAWVDLGFFGILYISIILIVPAFKLFFYGYFHRKKSQDFILVFSFMCIAILLLLMSHDFTDMLVGATLGAYTKYRYEEKNAKNRSPHVGSPPQRHSDFYQTVPQHGTAWLQSYAGGGRRPRR